MRTQELARLGRAGLAALELERERAPTRARRRQPLRQLRARKQIVAYGTEVQNAKMVTDAVISEQQHYFASHWLHAPCECNATGKFNADHCNSICCRLNKHPSFCSILYQ